MNNNLEIKYPEEMRDIMVAYMKSYYEKDSHGYPYGNPQKIEVTKRGFYSKLMGGYYDSKNKWVNIPEGYISVPPSYQIFNGVLLPHGWGGDRVRLEDVIKWEYCDGQ